MQPQVHSHGQSGDLHEPLLTQRKELLVEPLAFLDPSPGLD